MIDRLRQFHEEEGLIAAVQPGLGQALLWSVATGLMILNAVSPLVPITVALVMIFPARRREWLSIAAVATLVEILLGWTDLDVAENILQSVAEEPGRGGKVVGGAIVILLGLFIFFHAALRFDRWPGLFRRFPILGLHLGIWGALFLSMVPGFGILGQSHLLAWRLSYLLSMAKFGKIGGTRFRDHLFYLLPVYGGKYTPYGKGVAFLSRFEADEPEAMARSQLAGIKLLILAAAWGWLLEWIDWGLFGEVSPALLELGPSAIRLPELAAIFTWDATVSWYQGWIIVYLELIRAVLSLAAVGHAIIGCIRLLGFNVLRNTYKPLAAESIVEFWNRYFYYFKEVLVDFFFYPVYLRLSALSPAVRLLIAVFAAAFFGNIYFHILVSPLPVLNLDPATLWSTWGPRTVYCFFLALGIWISMLRQQASRDGSAVRGGVYRVRRIAGVWTFYSLIHIWNVRTPDAGFSERLHFMGSLIGL